MDKVVGLLIELKSFDSLSDGRYDSIGFRVVFLPQLMGSPLDILNEAER